MIDFSDDLVVTDLVSWNRKYKTSTCVVITVLPSTRALMAVRVVQCRYCSTAICFPNVMKLPVKMSVTVGERSIDSADKA